MGLDYHASSPCLVLPPSQQPIYHADVHPHHHAAAVGRRYPVPPSLNYLAATSNSAAGRKRSIHDVDPDDLPQDGSIVNQAPVKPRGEPIYGPGMTLIYPDDPGLNISAESQTGTWAEEKNDKVESEKSKNRPIAVSRKSQCITRFSSIKEKKSTSETSTKSIIDERGNTIDNLIAALGIGWKNIMTNQVLGDAARAYARVIENHFNLTEPIIMLESEGLSAYLVRARQDGATTYWLFHDTLSWCQLVGHTLSQAVENLKVGPVPRILGPQIHSTPRTTSSEKNTNDYINAASNDGDDAMQL